MITEDQFTIFKDAMVSYKDRLPPEELLIFLGEISVQICSEPNTPFRERLRMQSIILDVIVDVNEQIRVRDNA